MGKKKSVVFLTLITIAIVLLCAMIMIPSFELPFPVNGAISRWNPVVSTYDLDADLGGGYYTYYYPDGVISEVEYKRELAAKATDEAAADYEASYYSHKGLYLSTDPDDEVLVENADGSYTVSEDFTTNFAAAADEIAARYKEMGYSSFRVATVDDYALKIELPSSASAASAAFTYFAYTGEFTLSDGTTVYLEDNEREEVYAKDYFKSFKPTTQQDTVYIEVKLTSAGQKLIKDTTAALAASSSSSSSSSATLNFNVGSESVIQLTVSETIDQSTMYIGGGSYTLESAEVVSTLLNSAIAAGDLGISFTSDQVRSNEAVYGSSALMLLYIAIAVILVAAIVLPVVKCGGFGGACTYSTLSYLIVTALCFAFITSGVFEVTIGTAMVFLLGLLATVFINARIYSAIKDEFSLGKTVESSVKAGYKKTLAGTVDVYAVLILASVALLIGAGGLHTLAIQAIICFVTAAFCNLIWTRFISCMLLSVSKNKYKYFRFVREDDDDE